jgi:Uma2 family endonuclease
MNTTAVDVPHRQIVYPERDGKPMAESDTHRQVMADTIASLEFFFRAQTDVYVSGNLLLYYEEGNPAAVIAPDVFVVRGVRKGLRRNYLLWLEQRPPSAAIEISSRATRIEDLGLKRALYAMLGVAEYFIYDPLDEYLDPPLQGFRLVGGDYERLTPAPDGSLMSRELGLRLQGQHSHLRLLDPTTGQPLLRPAEVMEQRRHEAEARRVAEEHAQRAAEAQHEAEERAQREAEARRAAEEQARQNEERLSAADAELAALRAELARLRGADA